MKILLHVASSIILNDASKIFERKVELRFNLTQCDNRGLMCFLYIIKFTLTYTGGGGGGGAHVI